MNVAKSKQKWRQLLEKIPRPQPIWEDKTMTEGLQQAFPWANQETLQWVSSDLALLSKHLLQVLEQAPSELLVQLFKNQKPKSLSMLAKEESQESMLARHNFRKDLQDSIMQCIIDHVELLITTEQEEPPATLPMTPG